MREITYKFFTAGFVIFLFLLNSGASAYQRSCDFLTFEQFDDGNCITTTRGAICQLGYEYQYCEYYVTICEGGSMTGGFECVPLCAP